MDFDGFDWDSGNRDKCRKHGVSPVEIEDLFANTPNVGRDAAHSTIERRFYAIGRTTAGRHLFVVFTWRHRGKTRFLRPISARYMHHKEVQSHEEEAS